MYFTNSSRLATCGKLVLALSCVFSVSTTLAADENVEKPDTPEMKRQRDLFQSIQWQNGPCQATLGSIAAMQIPPGYRFTGKPGSATLMELFHNPPSESLEGIVTPADRLDWFVTFDYRDIGHVKDDEGDKLDADALLAALRANNEQSNAERRKRNWNEMHITGWIHPPAYEAGTHNLTWAIGSQDGGANSFSKILGRQGVMDVTLVADEKSLDAISPKVKELLKGYDFQAGNKYAEWRTGDKVAAYGLTGLITGGAVVAAAKTGLLAKFAALLLKAGKLIAVAVAGIGAWIWRMITGKSKKPTST